MSAVDLENLMKNTHEVTEENAELFSNFDVSGVPSAYVYNVPVHLFFSSCIESYDVSQCFDRNLLVAY